MKNFKLTIFAIVFSITIAFAQETEMIGDPHMSDEWIVSDFDKTELNDGKGERYFVKQWIITKVYTPVMLNPKDKYKLNQDIIYMPARVNKKLRLDNDTDKSYDKYVEFDYIKPKNSDLNFLLTDDGILVSEQNTNNSPKKIMDITSSMYKDVDKISTEGLYKIILSNNEIIKVKVANYNRM